MVASQSGHVKVVAALLDLGASVKSALPDGRTALSIAKANGHTKIVALLEQA
jgi:ankyrin repeat protein